MKKKLNQEKVKITSTHNELSLKEEVEKGDHLSWDILGSYTGVPEDGGMPVQDADDL